MRAPRWFPQHLRVVPRRCCLPEDSWSLSLLAGLPDDQRREDWHLGTERKRDDVVGLVGCLVLGSIKALRDQPMGPVGTIRNTEMLYG